MHIAVVFFGLARSLPVTIESIRRNIYACNVDRGLSFSTFASLNLVPILTNPRSGEVGISLNPADAFLLDADFYALGRQDDAAIAGALAAAQSQADVFDNDWVSIRNMLHQLTTLHRAWEFCTGVLAREFDYFLFLRPDLMYLDELRLSDLVSVFEGDGNIALPAWHSYGGFNDRFAFADPVAARHYARRLSLVSEWCAMRPVHPESLLTYALEKGECKVCELPVRAQRVRADGTVAAEAFDAVVLDLPQKPKRFSFMPGNYPSFSKEPEVMKLKETPALATRLTSSSGRSEAKIAGAIKISQEALPSGRSLRREVIDDFPRVTALRGLHYIEFLRILHRQRKVGRYLEIGTQSGVSLDCAVGKAVAIDPAFILDKGTWGSRPGISLFEMTSDAFFAAHDPRSFLEGAIDLAFIDGMHLSEYVLQDFVNVERYCGSDSIVILHDAVPQNFEMTERDRRPAARRDKPLAPAWTGDVWRVIPLLRRERPDLCIQVLDCPPTGLVLVSNLDPSSRTLQQRLDQLRSSLVEKDATESEFWSFIETEAVIDSRSLL